MRRATLILGLFVVLLGVESAAAKPIPKDVGDALHLKFEKGKVYFLEIKINTMQKMKVMQQDVNQEQDQVVVIQISPEARTPGNDWLVGMSIVSMRLKMNIGGNAIDFDSAKPMPGSPLSSYYEALLKAKFTATIAPTGEMRKFDGREELVKGLNDLPAGSDTLVKGMLSEAALKKMFMPIGEYLPDRAERVGAHWQRQGHVDIGPIGKYIYENKYSYHASAGPIHEIRATTSMKYQAPDKNDATLPFTIKGVKITKSDGSGTYQFDSALGRLKESTHEATFKATIEFSVGGMDTEMDLDQTQTTKIRTLDKNPSAK